nr:1,4-dihydroxy-2-naphthoate polyprenyltransferase [Bacteroidota bacterium]
MRSKTKAWIHAFRLRTLPLALSSIALGGFLAYADGGFSWKITLLAALATLVLQILSNLANDYGDSTHGVDNEKRVGPERAVQSGAITPGEMKRAVIIFAVLAFATGFIVLLSSFGTDLLNLNFITFQLLGLGAIVAAVKYTVGKNPYGYSGFGDLVVFCFFGLTGVIGTYYLNTHVFAPDVILPASAFGLLSVGVLNLNNMRDFENDKMNGKNTIVVKLGSKVAKYYHLGLLVVPILLTVIYIVLNYTGWVQFIFLLIIPAFATNIRSVYKNTIPGDLDPLLKQLALSSLAFTILFGLGLIL